MPAADPPRILAPAARPKVFAPASFAWDSADSLPTRMAVILLGLYLASVSSISAYIFSVYMNVSLPVVGAAFALAVVGYALSGDQLAFARTNFAFPWFALLVWWVIAAAFGMYPTGSLTFMAKYGYRLHVLPLLFVGIAKSGRAVGTLMYFIAGGYALVLFYCYRYGTVEADRFLIPDTILANANDLALHLLFGACFMLILVRRLPGRILWSAAMPILAYYVLKTGSRGNMLVFLIAVIVAVLIVPNRIRVTILIGAIATASVVIPMLPSGTLNRMLTFTSLSSRLQSYEQLQSEQAAVGSTEARARLQRRSIELTLRNPLLGVGPGMFPNALDELVQRTEKRKSSWQVSHNSYLQVSSEAGIPALICYVWCIALCLKSNYALYRNSLRAGMADVSVQSFCLFMASIVYALGILFCSIAYDYHLSILVGFTAANHARCQAAA